MIEFFSHSFKYCYHFPLYHCSICTLRSSHCVRNYYNFFNLIFLFIRPHTFRSDLTDKLTNIRNLFDAVCLIHNDPQFLLSRSDAAQCWKQDSGMCMCWKCDKHVSICNWKIAKCRIITNR
jgi:hypothetical protein